MAGLLSNLRNTLIVAFVLALILIVGYEIHNGAADAIFWQGVFRDPTEPVFAEAAAMIRDRESFTVDLMYGDVEGGQRMISRFSFVAAHDEAWLPAVSHHWNLDGPDPR